MTRHLKRTASRRGAPPSVWRLVPAAGALVGILLGLGTHQLINGPYVAPPTTIVVAR